MTIENEAAIILLYYLIAKRNSYRQQYLFSIIDQPIQVLYVFRISNSELSLCG
jgi:hypothetical protein